APPKAVRVAASSLVLLLLAAGELLGPLIRVVLGDRHVPPAGLVRSGLLELAVDLDRDQRRTARREAPSNGGGNVARLGDRFGVQAECAPDRGEVRRVDRAVRPLEVGDRGATEERLLAALDADPARVVEDDLAD